MEKLIIKKRENIACWKVDSEGAYPNTLINLDDGITLVIKIGSESAVCGKSDVTLFSLFNYGKKSKLIGGKKAYDNCEIFAIDTSSDFKSEWALAGRNAIACKDPEFDVDAKAISRGTYHYCIKDYFAFLGCFSFDKQLEFTRENVREYFRDQTENVVGPYLAPKVSLMGVDEANARRGAFADDIKFILNRSLEYKGVELKSFVIETIEYEPSHLIHREALKKAKIENTIKGVVNDGRRDDISVDKEASEIDIGIINALKGNGSNHKSDSDKSGKGKKIYCSRCGEPNDESANFCHKCGEKLHK